MFYLSLLNHWSVDFQRFTSACIFRILKT